MNIKHEKMNKHKKLVDLAPGTCFRLQTESSILMKLQRGSKSLVSLNKEYNFNAVDVNRGILRCIDEENVVQILNTELTIYD